MYIQYLATVRLWTEQLEVVVVRRSFLLRARPEPTQSVSQPIERALVAGYLLQAPYWRRPPCQSFRASGPCRPFLARPNVLIWSSCLCHLCRRLRFFVCATFFVRSRVAARGGARGSGRRFNHLIGWYVRIHKKTQEGARGRSRARRAHCGACIARNWELGIPSDLSPLVHELRLNYCRPKKN